LSTSFRKTVRVRGHSIFYEVFPTKEDFEAHNNMPYVKEWFSKVPKLAEGDVKTQMEVQKASRE
jgi:quinol monooxygenase YgiN